MTAKQLKDLLKDVGDDVNVLIPMKHEFDGSFYSPCAMDSGASKIGVGDFDEEEVNEMLLLGKEIPEEDVFLLIPCGFDEEKDHSHELN